MRTAPPWILVLLLPAATLVAGWLHSESSATGVARGRQVYVAEGCVHCHSQYLRPGTRDETWWGDPQDPEFSRLQTPALIGNRRQGPDLMQAGRRLSRDWQRRHLMDPRRVTPTSRMPAYAHLFAEGDPRGEALLDFLDSLGHEPDTGTDPGDRDRSVPN